MDKGLKKYLKGRMSIAVLVALCLIIALPATALAVAATNGPSYPTTTLGGQPGQIGTQVLSSPRMISGTITLNPGSIKLKTFVTGQSTIEGRWVPTYSEDGSTGTYTVVWNWAAGSQTGTNATLYGFPSSTLATGTYTVAATSTDASGAVSTLEGWSFVVTGTPVVVVPPDANASTLGCAAGCHVGLATIHKIKLVNNPNCASCHTGIDAPPHGFIVGTQTHADLEVAMATGANAECVACHSGDFMAVASASSGLTGVAEHAGCSCHNYHLANVSVTGCISCHKAATAPHGFANGIISHDGGLTFVGWNAASGHNTSQFGNIGAKTKFDGTGGNPLLTWSALQTFKITTLGTAAQFTAVTSTGTALTTGDWVSIGTTGTVQSTWDLPTIGTFWPLNDTTAPSTAKTGLGWTDQVACGDCHAGLELAMGPHGATWEEVGMDPNYQGDYSLAGLTKQVTSPGSGTWRGTSASGIAVVGSLNPAEEGSKTVVRAMFAAKANWSDGTTGAKAVICAKCHKLETLVPGYNPGAGETSRTAGKSGFPYDTLEGANTAHDNGNHNDSSIGANQCVSCHVAIPHGWKAPRLLVDVVENEGTPYASENAVEDMIGLSGVANHPKIAADGFTPWDSSGIPPTAQGSQYAPAHGGQVLWANQQCEGCADHYGEDAKRGLTADQIAAGNFTAAIPLQINER
ncbi:MAG: hypothetical protein WCJ13_06090 [Coriobacteriia bacterium]